MVHVPGIKSDPDARIGGGGAEALTSGDDYLMDEFEVSNKEFKKFVDSGGYGTENTGNILSLKMVMNFLLVKR